MKKRLNRDVINLNRYKLIFIILIVLLAAIISTLQISAQTEKNHNISDSYNYSQIQTNLINKISPELQQIISESPDEIILVTILLKEQPINNIAQKKKDKYKSKLNEFQDKIQGQFKVARKNALVKKNADINAYGSVKFNDEIPIDIASSLTETEKQNILETNSKFEEKRQEMIAEILNETKEIIQPQQEKLKNKIEKMGGSVEDNGAFYNVVFSRISARNIQEIADLSEVDYVEKTQISKPEMDTSAYSIYADRFWINGLIGTSFEVGVADTGVDSSHPALSSRVIAARDFVPGDSDGNNPDDLHGHGTHVSGTIASTDSIYKGIAYGANIINLKIGNSSVGYGAYDSDVMAGVDWAISGTTDPAEIISHSYEGGTSKSRFFDAVVDDLALTVVVAAGNSGPNPQTINYDTYNSIVVGGMNDINTPSRTDDIIYSSSSRGPVPGTARIKPDIMAPGEYITSAAHNWETDSDFVTFSGTSMAAPHISGAAALLMSAGVYDPKAIKALLINGAEDKGTTGGDYDYGWGYVDINHTFFHTADVSTGVINSSNRYLYYKGYAFTGDKASLVWNKHVNYSGASYPSTYYSLSDLNLYMYNESDSTLISYSNSSDENVEQVISNLNTNVVYKIQGYSFASGISSEEFAFASEEGFIQIYPLILDVIIENPENVISGENFNINVTVSNGGGIIAHGVNATISLPAGFTIVSGLNPQSLGSIDAGSSRIVSWVVKAPIVSVSTPYSLNASASSSSSYGESGSMSSSIMINPTPSRIITVNASGGADYTRIQDAVNASSYGDTIQVQSGIYYEHVTVNKQLNLTGVNTSGGKPVVNAGGNGDAIRLSANGITLEGFMAVNATRGWPDNDAGIRVVSSNNKIVGNTLSSNKIGIFLLYSNNNNITGNIASNNFYGIELQDSNFNMLKSNIFDNNSNGIEVFHYSNSNKVEENTASNNSNKGIDLYDSVSNNTVRNNTVNSNSNVGINIQDSNGNHIIYNIVKVNRSDVSYSESLDVYVVATQAMNCNNIIANNIGTNDREIKYFNTSVNFANEILSELILCSADSSKINNVTIEGSGLYLIMTNNSNLTNINSSNNPNGIMFVNSNQNNLSGNNLLNNKRGFYFWYSDNNNLANNTVISWSYGIYLYSSKTNKIYDNYFNDTAEFVYDSMNQWNITKMLGTNIVGGPFLGGNFWANPSGTGFSQTCADSNIDGICEINRTLNSLNIDYLPLASPDTTNPTITISSPSNGSILNNASVSIIGTSSDTRSGVQNVEVQIDEGVFNIASGTTSWTYSISSLSDDLHRITARATDNAGNNATKSINITVDTPPASITNLTNVTFASTYINWTWTDPQASDFSKVMIYLNGVFRTNISKGVKFYKAVGLTTNTTYEISTRTVDNIGNINSTWMNSTSTTKSVITVNASGGADYTRIQDAVNASRNGDTISVAAGTYNESVYVNKSVSLMGAGSNFTILNASNPKYAFNVTANYVNLSGFTAGGVWMYRGYGSLGINLDGVNYTNISNNNVSSNDYGIFLKYSSNNTLSDNIALNNQFGILISYSNNNNLINNKVRLNSWGGIFISRSSNNSIKNNIIANNWGQNGIYLFFSNNNNLTGNNVSNNNPYGIYLYSPSNDTIYDNIFNNLNNYGYSVSNYYNYWNITKQFGTNIIDGTFLGGNFWANPSGTGFSQTCADTNIDGICDTNLTLDSWNIDYLPLAAPDITNPTITISSPVNNTILNNASVSIIGTSLDTRSGVQNVEVQVDEGVFNIASGTTSWTYSISSLSEGTHRITAKTTDNAGNNATKSINITVDTTPPAAISNLTNVTYASTYINWTWTPPQDSDFSKVMIYLNGIFQTNVSKIVTYYKAVGLTKNTTYEISTRTVDNAGNINSTWMNITSKTNPIITVNASGGGADYTKIQDAIYNASNGDIIIVSAGTYIENVKVNRSVRLIGAGAKVTIVQAANSNDHVFNVTVDNVNITGFKITGATTNPKTGIYIYNSSNNYITGNNASNNYYGIYLYSSSNNTINGNLFSNSNNYGFGGTNNNNSWNFTKTAGINIVGAPNFGGNFWANPGGTGFSQICSDSNKDGICDSSYTLMSGNIDYLPLAAMPAGYGYISGSVYNSTGITGVLVTTNTSNSSTTDDSGSYYLLVPAGSYYLTATKEPVFYQNSSVTVIAIAGSTIIQDIELIQKPMGAISGFVGNS